MKKKKKTTPGILQILNFQQLESPLKYPHQTLEKVKAQQHFFICKKKQNCGTEKFRVKLPYILMLDKTTTDFFESEI